MVATLAVEGPKVNWFLQHYYAKFPLCMGTAEYNIKRSKELHFYRTPFFTIAFHCFLARQTLEIWVKMSHILQSFAFLLYLVVCEMLGEKNV